MSYQVLARKWRPQTFDDVVGQEPVVRTLKRALETGRVAHAFLFCGSRGIGKTTLARIMAKCLCCEKGVTPDPCGVCVHCREIVSGSAVDVVEIDGASHTGVDNIRELREVARFQPQSCRFKVFIIDEVHMLSVGAFNALLKTLEEPPPHVKFIFATTEPHKIPVTILSRCQRYDFKRIRSDEIVGRLQAVLREEGSHLEEAGLYVIARAAEGGMRDALSLTDQVLSFAGEGAGADAVAEALGLIDRRTIVRATAAVIGRDARAALSEVDRCFDQGYDLRQFAEALCAELRHLTVASSTGTIRGFVDLADEDLDAIEALAKANDPRDLMRLFSAALDGLDRLGETENEKLALELTVLRLAQRPPVTEAVAVSEALVRLDALSRGRAVPPLGPAGGRGGPALTDVDDTLARAAPSAPPAPSAPSAPAASAPAASAPAPSPPAPSPPAPTPPAPTPPASPPPPPPSPSSSSEGAPEAEDGGGDDMEEADLGLDLEEVDERWVHFVRALERSTATLGGSLTHGVLLGVEVATSGPRVRVGFSKAHHLELVKAAAAKDEVKSALSVFGAGAFLETEALEGDAAPPQPTIFDARRRARERIQAALEEHAREHPVVQKALELFGGEIRAVRR